MRNLAVLRYRLNLFTHAAERCWFLSSCLNAHIVNMHITSNQTLSKVRK